MSSTDAIYQHRSDEVARSTTISVQTGTPPDPTYQPTELVDENPAKVAKIESTTGAWLFDNGGVKLPVELVALIHHDFDAGADVKIQGNDTNSWGSPSFSASITIPAWLGAGTLRWPVNPWLNLTEQSGYDASGWKYWRLIITGNSQNLQLGEVWFGSTIRRLTPNYRWDFKLTTNRPIIESKTAFSVSTIYGKGTALWQQDAEVRMNETLRDALEAQWHDVGGRMYPFLWIPDPTVNACYLVRWGSTEQAWQVQAPNYFPMTLTFEEVARGLRPGN